MNHLQKMLSVVLISGLSVILAACATPGGMVTDSPNPGMTKIFYEVEVNAPKSKAWEVLADYTNLSWVSSVKSAHYLNEKREGLGMTRRCDLSDGGFIVERIIAWDEGNGYTYVIDDANDPISTDSYVIWHISGDEKKSKVSFEVHYELKYGILGDAMNVMMAKKRFSNQIVEFMGELKTHLEKKT